MKTPRPRPDAVLLGLAMVALACGGGERDRTSATSDGGSDTAAASAAASPAAATADGLAVLDPWVRAAIRPPGMDSDSAAGSTSTAAPANSAAYLTIRNDGSDADALVAASSPVAGAAEIHSVSMDDGVMRMWQVDSLAVPPGGEAVLEPGSYHVMLIGLTRTLPEGDTVSLTLRFRSGRTLTVRAPVRLGG